MAKLTLSNVSSGYATSTLINSNNDLIEAAIENTLSRDGSSPNAMSADLDMNSNELLNVSAPSVSSSGARLADIEAISATTLASGTAVTTTLTDTVGYYTSTNVEGALQEIAENPITNVLPADQYADLDAAIAAIGSDVRTLVISSSFSAPNTNTIPSTLTLWFVGDGQLSVAASKTVTLGTTPIAGDKQIFAGSGAVTFAAGSGAECNVMWWGAVPDWNGSTGTDSTTAFQAAVDAARVCGGTVTGPGTGSLAFQCTGEVILTDTDRGTFPEVRINLEFRAKARVVFTNAGDAGDALDAMAKGFAAYKTSATGETSGWINSVVSNLKVEGPANGCGWWLSNCSAITFERCDAGEDRYGWAVDSCIAITWRDWTVWNNVRAGVGCINSGDSKVYNQAEHFNDSMIFEGRGSISGSGSFTGIEHHGSASEGLVKLDGVTATGTRPYGFAGGKGISLVALGGWYENIDYPIYFRESGAGGNFPLTSIPFSDFAGGQAYSLFLAGTEFFASGLVAAITLNGVRDTAALMGYYCSGDGAGSTDFVVNNQDSCDILDGGGYVTAATKWNLTYKRRSEVNPIKKAVWQTPGTAENTATLATRATGTRYAVASIGSAAAAGDLFFGFTAPPGFVKYRTAKLVVFSPQTGDAYLKIDSHYAAAGEAVTADGVVGSAAALAVTADTFKEIDITPYIPAVAEGDYIGLAVNRDGTHASDTITDLYVVGLFLEYQG